MTLLETIDFAHEHKFIVSLSQFLRNAEDFTLVKPKAFSNEILFNPYDSPVSHFFLFHSGIIKLREIQRLRLVEYKIRREDGKKKEKNFVFVQSKRITFLIVSMQKIP